MTYNYCKLWNLLIDKNELDINAKQASISTNILVNMDKDAYLNGESCGDMYHSKL